MPELPGPPSDYSDAERRAWREGAATVAQLLGQQAEAIAGGYEPDDEDGGGDDDACPECGGDVVDGLGGRRCADCGHHFE